MPPELGVAVAAAEVLVTTGFVDVVAAAVVLGLAETDVTGLVLPPQVKTLGPGMV